MLIVQYIRRNMHTVFALLCFVVVIHWLIFPYPSGLLHWHCGNLTIAPMPAKQPWWIWINAPCEFIMNDCITTTKQSTTKPCAYFLGYTVHKTDRLLCIVCQIGPDVRQVNVWSVQHYTQYIYKNVIWKKNTCNVYIYAKLLKDNNKPKTINWQIFVLTCWQIPLSQGLEYMFIWI